MMTTMVTLGTMMIGTGTTMEAATRIGIDTGNRIGTAKEAVTIQMPAITGAAAIRSEERPNRVRPRHCDVAVLAVADRMLL